jgi:hypothetical protein
LFENNEQAIIATQAKEKEWNAQASKEKEATRDQRGDFVSQALQQGLRKKKEGTGKNAAELAAQYMSAYGVLEGGEGKGSSAFSRRADFGQESSTTVAAEKLISTEAKAHENANEELAIMAERKANLEAVRDQLKKSRELRMKIDTRTEANQSVARQMKGDLGQQVLETGEIEKSFKIKKRTLDLLPDADNNILKLGGIAETSAARLVDLAAQWEEHRQPLVSKYRRKKQQVNERVGEVGVKMDQIKRMRQETKQKASDAREKEELYRQVLAELEKMPKSINRQVYVRRIMDVVKNLEKQNDDIKAVLEDVYQVQKDINMLAGKAKRSFDEVDETVFSVAKAKKDPTATTTYKYVVQLRDGFEELINNVEQVGKIKNEIRDISSSVEALETRNTSSNMKQVQEDLVQVKEENKKLASQIKKKRG